MAAMGIEEGDIAEAAPAAAVEDKTKAGGLDVKGKVGQQAKKVEEKKGGYDQFMFLYSVFFCQMLRFYQCNRLLHTSRNVSLAEEFKLPPITVQSLMKEKAFQKATKAQFKQLDAMQKKHKKEREGMQKSQCTAIEKLAAKKS